MSRIFGASWSFLHVVVGEPNTLCNLWLTAATAGAAELSNRLLAFPGRPSVCREVTELVLRLARENTARGYDRIAGALDNLSHGISDQTVGNILRRFGIAPAPKRREQMNWADFIRSHIAVLTGIDFFTVEVLIGAD
ncbi:MAG: hypothetical protein ACR2IV_16715 [Bryobacteraceae bacterium]